MDLVLPYIPMDRRVAMVRGDTLPEQTHGAALFADISGFTPLTEALAKELGPKRGAEELTRQLDRVYGVIIREVDSFRGSVIGFAGDAITCWFDADDGRRAVACGLAMQAVMSRFGHVQTPSAATIPLAIKVAIAVGPMRRFRVGAAEVQYIDVLAGSTVYRMAEVEHQARTGEVVVVPEVVGALGADLVVREWRRDPESGHACAVITALNRPVARNPWPVLPPGSLRAEQVQPWLHPQVYARLAGGQGQFLAELRPAVALFMRFGGIDFDADAAAGEKLDSFIRWAQSILARQEGTLIQLTIGDKGSFLYSAFGAPVAHDDDASRAIAAALELRTVPPALDFIQPPQIGISRGRMRAGAYGGPTARTYGVLGEEVNVAARLMAQAAPGEILISERIAGAMHRHYDIEVVGPIRVKGKRESVHVSRVRAERRPAAPAAASGLVGRERELAQLNVLLAGAARGQGRILRLEGPTGVGKSRLALELIRGAEARGFRVAVGVCQSTTRSTAYAAWRQVFHTLLGLDAAERAAGGPLPVAAQITLLTEQLGAANPDWRLRLPLLGDLLGLPIADNATTSTFEPRLRQSALLDLAVEMARSWAGAQPLLILLDDVHWLDEASQSLTLALGRTLAAHPIVLAVLHRPTLDDIPVLPELDALPALHRIDLGELSRDAVAALVAGRLGGDVAPLVQSLIQSETQGNAFFIEELVDSLRESGGIKPDANGRWVLSQPMFAALRRAECLARVEGEWVLTVRASLSTLDLGLPDSIQRAVLSRLDRLPEGPKLTMRVASVIGRVFALALLGRVHPLQPLPETLRRQIAVLEERDFARLEVPPPDPAYIFKHNITQDVGYETLLSDQRRGLHRAVGRALEELDPQAIDQLAYHTFQGEDWPRALGYQLEAGRRAQRLFANHQAIQHFEKALHCAEQLPPEGTLDARRQIHASLGQLLTGIGQYDPAMDHLQTALTLAEQLDSREGQADACRWIARIHENKAEYAAARDWIGRGLAALGDRETTARAEMLAIAGLISTRQGQYEQALEQCAESAHLAEALDDKSALAFAYNARAIISYQRGMSADAVEYFRRALDAYDDAGNIHGLAMSSNGIGNSYVKMGNWVEGEKYLLRARRIFDQTGDVYNSAFADNNLGELARFQGRLDAALEFYSRALDTLEQVGGSRYATGVLHMNLGATHARRGDAAAARDQLQAGLDDFAQAQTRDYLPEVHRHLAEAAQAAGDLAQAEAEVQQALDLARELAMRGDEGNSLHILGQVAAAHQDAVRAERLFAESMAILEEVGHEYDLACVQLSLADLYIGQGRLEPGGALLDRCAAVFSRLDAHIELAAVERVRRAADGIPSGP